MPISCDGKRLCYVSELAAFTLYADEPPDKQLMRAILGSVSFEEAEKAIAECVVYLEFIVGFEEDVA